MKTYKLTIYELTRLLFQFDALNDEENLAMELLLLEQNNELKKEVVQYRDLTYKEKAKVLVILSKLNNGE